MATKTTELHQTFLLNRRTNRVKWFAPLEAESLSSPTRIRDSLARASRDTLWISFEKELTHALLRPLPWPVPALGSVLLLHRPDVETLTVLRDCFRDVVFSLNGGFLALEELGEVLAAENRAHLFIGGTVNPSSKTVTLWRGNFSSLTVPWKAFGPSGVGTRPDFSQFSVTDHGHTIQLGDYEAASDAVLYEFDSEYRRAQAKHRRASERSFGASLRRLRKQRKLRREDFAPLSAKTIARIERGQVTRVRDRTLAILAKKLRVVPADIQHY